MQVKENIKLGKYSHFKYALIFIPLLLAFYICQKFLEPKHIMHSSIDDSIPFLKWFILAYLLWFVYIAVAFLYFGLKSPDDFIKLAKFTFWGMGISYIIYFIWPSGQNLRPVINGDDIFIQAVKFIYSIDPPTNVCPSIHVINAIAVNSVVWNSLILKKKQKVRIISFVIMILICASTVFIKQHSIIDVAAGVGLSTIIYIIIFVIEEKYKTFKNNELDLSKENKV